MLLVYLGIQGASGSKNSVERRIREPRSMYDALALHGRGTNDKRLGLLGLGGGKGDDIATLKGNGKLFAFGGPRNYRRV
jgi:hypothetical protein